MHAAKPISWPIAHMYSYIIPSLPTIHIRYPNTVHRAYARTNSWIRSLSGNLLCHSGGSCSTKTGDSIRNRAGSGLPDGLGSLLCGVSERSVACPVVERAASNDCDVVGEVKRGGNSEHGYEEEEDGVCSNDQSQVLLLVYVVWKHVLKTNFSVGVSM